MEEVCRLSLPGSHWAKDVRKETCITIWEVLSNPQLRLWSEFDTLISLVKNRVNLTFSLLVLLQASILYEACQYTNTLTGREQVFLPA